MVDCATASLSIVFGCEFLVVACHDCESDSRKLAWNPSSVGSLSASLETMICHRQFVTGTFILAFSVPLSGKQLEVTCQILRLFDVKFDVDAILKGFTMKEMMKKGMVAAIKEAGEGAGALNSLV